MLLLLLAMTLMRIVFFLVFPPAIHGISANFDAFLMGFRYDLRMACIVVLPVFLIGSMNITINRGRITGAGIARLITSLLFIIGLVLFMRNNKFSMLMMLLVGLVYLGLLCWLMISRNLNPFFNHSSRKVWIIYLTLASLLFGTLYAVDFQNYDYLHQRLNASVLGYTKDAAISFKMIWQSYPIIQMILGIALFTILLSWSFKKLFTRVKTATTRPAKPRSVFVQSVIYFILLSVAIFGSISQFPLRWSDAYSLGSDYKANLALNPVQSFFSSLRFKNSGYKIEKVKEYYPEMARHLGVNRVDTATLNFSRQYPATANESRKMNVVLVLCESFSSYKSSMWGNPLNTTPYFNNLSKQGAFFTHCFTPAYGTARGVWATVTGIPDVEPAPGTASRNPAAVDQHTIINDFTGYEKFYFLGGSTSWANIRGLLTNNIEGLKLYEEGSYKSAAIDVWGISDKQLFMEANDVLKKQAKPFFAMIQTAGNHRPYTIPPEDQQEFKSIELPDDSLRKHGFESNKELNAFRYTDYCFRKFMEAASKEAYFQNTIFVFIGDHGIRGDAGKMLPRVYTEAGLTTQHVPLLFYAPAIIQPGVSTRIASQVDVLPTIAGIAGIAYSNTTMGRDLFSAKDSSLPYADNAFLFDPDKQLTGMISKEFCYMKQHSTGKESLMFLNNDDVPSGSLLREHIPRLGRLTAAWVETAKYLMLNNKKTITKP